MKRVFISQPMKGKSNELIKEERKRIEDTLRKQIGEFEIIDSYFPDFPKGNKYNIDLKYLGASLQLLAEADLAVFGPGWANARGCKIEHLCCEEYGIFILDNIGRV
jgi:hypothetical protein